MHSYYQAAVRADWTDWAIERMEDWSPTTNDLARAMEEVWVRGYKLVMSVYQMERWERAREKLISGERPSTDPPAVDDYLTALRNTIEHLDEAHFSDVFARRHPNESRRHVSIEDLPGKELFLGFERGYIHAAFGIVHLKDAVGKARRYDDIDDEWRDWEPDDIDLENMRFGDHEPDADDS